MQMMLGAGGSRQENVRSAEKRRGGRFECRTPAMGVQGTRELGTEAELSCAAFFSFLASPPCLLPASARSIHALSSAGIKHGQPHLHRNRQPCCRQPSLGKMVGAGIWEPIGHATALTRPGLVLVGLIGPCWGPHWLVLALLAVLGPVKTGLCPVIPPASPAAPAPRLPGG